MSKSKKFDELKSEYELFSKSAMTSDFFKQLAKNNKAYRHILRFITHLILFAFFMLSFLFLFNAHVIYGLIAYPAYLFFQGLLISGFMIHSHELSHNQIKNKLLNDFIGIISGAFSFMNFYSFQYAHRFHHKNIGNLDTPEVGAPVSLSGQKKILDDDKLHRLGLRLFNFSMPLWFLLSWPLFIYYGDYSSWILPFKKNNKTNIKSLLVFMAFCVINLLLAMSHPFAYLSLYLLPVLIGGNRILVITSMHHAHEDTVFFQEKDHSRYNQIMSTTDRDFGRIVNYFMMNNGYHIAHHMNTQIAYYDYQKASQYLRKTLPSHLQYHYYPQSHFYHDFIHSYYEKRLEQDYPHYQLKYLP